MCIQYTRAIDDRIDVYRLSSFVLFALIAIYDHELTMTSQLKWLPFPNELQYIRESIAREEKNCEFCVLNTRRRCVELSADCRDRFECLREFRLVSGAHMRTGHITLEHDRDKKSVQ